MEQIDNSIITNIGVNPSILVLNHKVAITHFESDTRQLFETEEGSYVYFKEDEKLHKLETDSYTKLLLKLTTYIDNRDYDIFNKAKT